MDREEVWAVGEVPEMIYGGRCIQIFRELEPNAKALRAEVSLLMMTCTALLTVIGEAVSRSELPLGVPIDTMNSIISTHIDGKNLLAPLEEKRKGLDRRGVRNERARALSVQDGPPRRCDHGLRVHQ